MSALLNPYLLLAGVLAAWGLWRLGRWLASGGRMPLRGRRGSASGFTAAGLAMDAFYRPSARYAHEAKLRDHTQREDEDEGDSPEAGVGRAAR